MNTEIVKRLFTKIAEDTKLAQDYIELLKKNKHAGEMCLAEKIVEFGNQSGFAFSPQDLFAARAELLDRKNSNSELSNNDLGNVASGAVNRKAEIITASVIRASVFCEAKNAENICRQS